MNKSIPPENRDYFKTMINGVYKYEALTLKQRLAHINNFRWPKPISIEEFVGHEYAMSVGH